MTETTTEANGLTDEQKMALRQTALGHAKDVLGDRADLRNVLHAAEKFYNYLAEGEAS